MRSDPLSLLVIDGSGATTRALSVGSRVIVGSGAEADVRVDASAAGQHVAVTVDEEGAWAEALTDTPTRIMDTLMKVGERHALQPGRMLTLGTAMVVVQPRSPTQSRRIWAHGSFEVRLEEQCIRAERYREQFILLRIRLTSVLEPSAIEAVLTNSLRLTDIIGVYGPSEYEVILAETNEPESRIVIERLESQFVTEKLDVKLGIAVFPRDGLSSDALVSTAEASVRGLPNAPASLSVGPVMTKLRDLVERVAQSSLSVLLLGETGVGKERMAELVHSSSPRRAKPLLRLNCAALTETLLESELFGHERGAFTGAVAAKQGLLETADGGTVFLDEVGELPLATQTKLLRVIEERQVLRVGGLKSRGINVRFVSATNRDLEAEIRRGTFREDLFFRINGVALNIPPLRERTDEIEGLARLFIETACQRDQRPRVPKIADTALRILKQYHWPGNVRELRNVIERAVLLCQGEAIDPTLLPVEKMTATFVSRATGRGPVAAGRLADSQSGSGNRSRTGSNPGTPAASTPSGIVTNVPPPAASPTRGPATSEMPDPGATPSEWNRGLEALEKKRFLAALEQCAGNQTAAAKLVGVSRRTFINRLESWAVSRPRKGRA